jgi:hypothetical protein
VVIFLHLKDEVPYVEAAETALSDTYIVLTLRIQYWIKLVNMHITV